MHHKQEPKIEDRKLTLLWSRADTTHCMHVLRMNNSFHMRRLDKTLYISSINYLIVEVPTFVSKMAFSKGKKNKLNPVLSKMLQKLGSYLTTETDYISNRCSSDPLGEISYLTFLKINLFFKESLQLHFFQKYS